MKVKALLISMLPGCILTIEATAAEFVQVNPKNLSRFFSYQQHKLIGHDKKDEFILSNTIQLPHGVTKNKYTEYYDGIPVYGSNLSSTNTSGHETHWWGRYLSGITDDLKSTKIKLTPIEAINNAKAFINLTPSAVTELHQSRLYVKQNDKSLRAELVYLVSFNIAGPQPQRPHFFIDALTGKMLHQWEGLTTQNAEGPGGNEKIGQYFYGKDYSALEVSDTCEMKTNHVETYDMNHQQTGGTIYQFTCPTNTHKSINGAYSPLNDAHYFGNVVYKMYSEWFNVDPLNMVLKLRVHFSQNYENAYWDGEQMTFGDGGSMLYPLTVLDVASHEISHGVTERNSNLAYELESGGINEAFSDMAGQTAQYYMNQNNDWMVGAGALKGPKDDALRYFIHPSLDGQSIDHANDYYEGLDVHYSSGVFNRAFYLLSTHPEWDVKKAFEIFLVANRVYWTSDATFDSAACGVVKAATDLSYPVDDIIDSFSLVGVDATCKTDTM